MLWYYLIPISFRGAWLAELVEWHGAYLKFKKTNKKPPTQYVFIEPSNAMNLKILSKKLGKR